MPRYAADDDVPPSPSSATGSSSSGFHDSDTEDEREAPPVVKKEGGATSPVVWVVVGMVVMLAAGIAVYFAVRGFPSSSSEETGAGAASAEGSSKASTSAASSSHAPSAGQSAAEDDDETAFPSTTGDSSPSSAASASPSSSSSTSGTSSLPPLVGTSLLVDFSSYSGSSASDLSSFLSSYGLVVSTDFIGSTPVTHTFMEENIDWEDGALRLKVTGQSAGGTEDVKSAEFATTDNILYGRVTTRAKASPVEGVCHGFFYYADDNHEVDIELLSSFYTEGKGEAVAAGCQFTNQALVPGGKVASKAVPYGFDPTADFHDYTIDWSADATTFSVDGEVVMTLTENVPTTPMAMLWNSWSSGGDNWSAGPPTEDSYLLISGIAANWTVDGGGGSPKGEEGEDD
ncbi:hypothetical protein JCM6882_003064 [Rhodosporidiobolus microsporus]